MVLLVSFWRVGLIPLSASSSWSVGGCPQWPPLVGTVVTLSPIPRTLGLSLLGLAQAHSVPWICLWHKGSADYPTLPSEGEPPPQKTSSSVKERYHFTSSLSSNMLFTNKHGSPPAGRLFCSTQCWRALAYATTFSLGISLISLHAKIESAGGINFCLQRHGGAGGAWRVVSLEPNSCNCCGSPKDAHTSLASFLESSTILGSCISLPSMGPTGQSLKLWALKMSSCPHPQKSLATLSGRRLPSASVLAAPPSRSLCHWTPPYSVVFWGWQSHWGQVALQTGFGSASSFALLCSVFGHPYFWT